MFPAPLLDATQQSLILILQPDLAEDDLAFKHSSSNTINSSTGTISGNFVEKEDDDEMKDKQIRAVFMRLFAQLLQGYRSCLTIIRIHPKPVITFNKSGFLGAKDLIENEFISRVLESMFFTGFVNERGPPWRQIDA
uniref:UDENN domain-containing protein n=1 Tax=Megaselia scalaris TaxID=36166 RepID=T1GPN4_MEGSC